VSATALGLLVGAALDQVLPDPRRGHPVALFGSVAARVERSLYRDSRVAGTGYAAALVSGSALLGWGFTRASGARLFALTAAGTWAVLGGRSLAAEAAEVRSRLSGGDLPAARQRLTHLVGRRTDELDESEIARAAVESVAENTCDAVVAPLFWGALFGLPGLLAYRAVNTLDAMVGHHNPRYEQFGWASARADDVANFVPARLTAVLTALAAPVVGGSSDGVLRVARTDGRRHPSPNSGMSEAAFAGALGIRLGGVNDYGSHVESRPVLGAAGHAPVAADLGRTARLSRAVGAFAAILAAGFALWRKGDR
jgi:adenosylcobinamide-phosphate synthase